ncbi:MAG: polysaccharide deacetylase family protein [Bacilli bacterium]
MKKKHFILMISSLILIVVIFATSYYFYKDYKEKEQLKSDKELVTLIKSKYNLLVITNKDSVIYKLNNKKYVKTGTISKSVELELDELKDISKETKYFKLKNIDYYIDYKDIDKLDNLSKSDTNYKNFIPFNENIKSSDIKLYNKEQLIYQISDELSLPIIIKDNDKLFVEYDNKLLYALKNEIKEVVANNNSDKIEATSVPVIAYHFIYNPNTDEPCNQIICHTEAQLESHLKYLTDNNYTTIRAKELDMFFDKKIRLPKNTIMITLDDGWGNHKATPLLEKYKKHATYFIVTSWNKKEEFISDYVELHSHSHNLHNPGICYGGQGSAMKCLQRDKLLLDLKTSREKLDNSTVFCYPYYEYNNYAINALKEAGFTMAFAGGNIKARQNSNKFAIPRITLLNSTTVEDLSEILR